MNQIPFSSFSRRKFLAASVSMLAASGLEASALHHNQDQLTIAQVIELIKKSISFEASGGTVDTIKSGDDSQPVKGIVTTMFATVDVIRKAIELGANFIIAHEPTFYNHLDETSWLRDHEIFRMKNDLLSKNNIVVWRFHDYIHSHNPDGVLVGVLNQLGWEKYYNSADPWLLDIPSMKLSAIISLAKKALKINTLRYVGDPGQDCRKILLIPGAAGGRRQIQAFNAYKPDLLICGELQEWETSEYIRDARSFGMKASVLVLGHAVSEEPGMEWLVPWLSKKVPSIKVTHIESGSPFQYA